MAKFGGLAAMHTVAPERDLAGIARDAVALHRARRRIDAYIAMLRPPSTLMVSPVM
jgi:hypothetical protein